MRFRPLPIVPPAAATRIVDKHRSREYLDAIDGVIDAFTALRATTCEGDDAKRYGSAKAAMERWQRAEKLLMRRQGMQE